MAKFQNKASSVFDALPWFKVGDETPGGVEVLPFRNPAIVGEWPCAQCGKPMHYHGNISTKEGVATVCPNDWIVVGDNAEPVMIKPDAFTREFSPSA